MEAAPLLGTQALRLGMDTLDLAAIHQQALSILEPAGGTPLEFAATTKLAEDFFGAALLPIEATHRTAIEGRSNLERLSTELAQINRELDDSARDLERGIVERKTAEKALTTSGERSAKLLDESQRLFSNVEELARRILGANEEERRTLSLRLQDEIAQTLLGIHLRLLTLRSEVTANSENLNNEIDVTHRLVRNTVSMIDGVLSDLGIAYES